jgi:hypothetical protein
MIGFLKSSYSRKEEIEYIFPDRAAVGTEDGAARFL